MTTIAVNKEMMSADSEAFDGIRSKCLKLATTSNGDIIGIAGAVRDLPRFLEWYEHQSDEIDTSDSMFIVLTKKGKLFTYESGIAIPVLEKFYAIGTGAQAAMGAMYAGCTPEEAVKIACKVDASTNGQVRTIKR